MNSVSDVELLRLIDQHCTIEDVQKLLRKAKKRSDTPSKVLIGASDKATLINSNLADALSSGAISRDEAYDLLRQAEENGNQHVFYFRRTAKSSLNPTLDAVGRTILGADWKKQVPRSTTVEREYVIADLRATNKNDWILKSYGQQTITRYGRLTTIEGQKYLPVHEDTMRVVLVAQWRHPGLLELRVPRDESRRRITHWLATIWSKIGKALPQSEFQPWDLVTVRRKLIEREEENSAVYSARDTRFLDSDQDSRASFEGHGDAYNLFAKLEYLDAAKNLIKAGDVCTHLGIKWLRQPNQAVPSREIHTLLMGERVPNEMVVVGHCESADGDFITQKLRQYSR
jgi:hypothetical protein